MFDLIHAKIKFNEEMRGETGNWRNNPANHKLIILGRKIAAADSRDSYFLYKKDNINIHTPDNFHSGGSLRYYYVVMEEGAEITFNFVDREEVKNLKDEIDCEVECWELTEEEHSKIEAERAELERVRLARALEEERSKIEAERLEEIRKKEEAERKVRQEAERIEFEKQREAERIERAKQWEEKHKIYEAVADEQWQEITVNAYFEEFDTGVKFAKNGVKIKNLLRKRNFSQIYSWVKENHGKYNYDMKCFTFRSEKHRDNFMCKLYAEFEA